MAADLQQLIDESPNGKLRAQQIVHAYPSPERGEGIWTVVAKAHKKLFIGYVFVANGKYEPMKGDAIDVRPALDTEKSKFDIQTPGALVALRTDEADPEFDSLIKKKKEKKSGKSQD